MFQAGPGKRGKQAPAKARERPQVRSPQAAAKRKAEHRAQEIARDNIRAQLENVRQIYIKFFIIVKMCSTLLWIVNRYSLLTKRIIPITDKGESLSRTGAASGSSSQEEEVDLCGAGHKRLW